MSTFTDMVLARRKRSWALEAKASASITRALSSVATEAKRQLARMNAGFAPDGHFIDTASARRAAQAAIADVKDTIKSATAKSGLILSGVNETAFNQSLLDANYAIESATGLNADMGASFNQIFQQAAYQARTREVMDVSPIRAFTGTGAWMEDRYRETFMEAVVNGEAVQSTSNKLRKISGITDRAAQRITRTNIQAAMNDAHRLVYESNDDLFDGFIWVSTLDELTSQICAALDGKFFPLGSSPPGPPAHPNCRSVLVGHFRDPDLQAEQESDERRARQFGPDGSRYQPDSGSLVGTELIPADTTYDEWLLQQHPAVTRQVTGSRLRDELWRNGSLQLEELVNPLMEPITDAQAARRVASKFPANAHYQELAKKYGQTPVDWKTILKEDRAMVKSSPHTQPKTLKPKKKPTPPGPQPLTEAEKLALDAENAAKRAKENEIVQTGKDASTARIDDTIPNIPDEFKTAKLGDEGMMQRNTIGATERSIVNAILKGEDPWDAAKRIGKLDGKTFTASQVKELERTAKVLQYRAQTELSGFETLFDAERMDEVTFKNKFLKGSRIKLDELRNGFDDVAEALATNAPSWKAMKPGEVNVSFTYTKPGGELNGARLGVRRKFLNRGHEFEVEDVVKTQDGYMVKMRSLEDLKNPWYTLDDFTPAEQRLLKSLGLEDTGITRAEFNAISKKLDDLVAWRKEMDNVGLPYMPGGANPALPNQPSGQLVKTRFGIDKAERDLEVKYAAKSELMIERARVEMDALGITTEMMRNNPEMAAEKLLSALTSLNKTPVQQAIIDDIIKAARAGMGNGQILDLSLYGEGKFGGDMEKALAAFRRHLDSIPASLLSDRRIADMRFTPVNFKGGPVEDGGSFFSPAQNKLHINPSTEGREFIHEFNHALEAHNDAGKWSAAKRDSYMSLMPDSNDWEISEFRTNQYTTNKGNLWNDYAGRVYGSTISQEDTTEIMTMVGEQLNVLAQRMHVPSQRSHGAAMLRMNPDLVRFYWAWLRNLRR